MKDWTPEQRQLVFPNKVGRIMQYSSFLEDHEAAVNGLAQFLKA